MILFLPIKPFELIRCKLKLLKFPMTNYPNNPVIFFLFNYSEKILVFLNYYFKKYTIANYGILIYTILNTNF